MADQPRQLARSDAAGEYGISSYLRPVTWTCVTEPAISNYLDLCHRTVESIARRVEPDSRARVWLVQWSEAHSLDRTSFYSVLQPLCYSTYNGRADNLSGSPIRYVCSIIRRITRCFLIRGRHLVRARKHRSTDRELASREDMTPPLWQD